MCYNIWVDLIGFHISNATENQFYNSPRYPYFASRMRAGLSEELLIIFDDLNDAVYDLGAKKRIMDFVQAMSYEGSVAYLETCGSARFYKAMMNNQICLIEDLRVLAHGTGESVGIQRWCKTSYMVGSQWGRTYSKPESDAAYDRFTSLNEDRLVFLLNILRKLRASIAVVASERHPPEVLLTTLRLRLQVFDQGDLYMRACSTVSWASPQKSQFLANSETWWLVTHYKSRVKPDMQRDTTSNSNHDAALPDKVAYAYPLGKKTRSTLTFIVPTIMLFSAIPAAIAWKRDDSITGTTRDSNFWQAVSSSMLQLLSLITFIWPAMKDPQLPQITRVWIWVLSVFSATCTVANVPVYLVAPTIWSFLISFIGALAQSVVQLQVVNAI